MAMDITEDPGSAKGLKASPEICIGGRSRNFPRVSLRRVEFPLPWQRPHVTNQS
jgi:hypothetical protein